MQVIHIGAEGLRSLELHTCANVHKEPSNRKTRVEMEGKEMDMRFFKSSKGKSVNGIEMNSDLAVAQY